jgi:hypothetical protein
MAAPVSATANSFSVGAVQEVPQLRVQQSGPSVNVSVYDVFPDGQRFIISALKAEALHNPLTLVTNWPAALPK